MNPLINQLKQNGYEVRIKHYRIFERGHEKYGKYDDRIHCVDNVLTKGQFLRLVRDNELNVEQSGCTYGNQSRNYSEVVSPKGGFTEAEIKLPNGEVKRGKFNFNNKPFHKKLGTKVALMRASAKIVL